MTKLRPFQKATIKEIVRRVKGSRSGIRLALADEVGLGKTHVMGAASKAIAGRRVVMYVAPSLEVAHQNRIRLERELGVAAHATGSLESRLTLIPVELAKRGTRLICLTPNTSFQLRGAGNRRERAFLYAVFRTLRPRLGRVKGIAVAGHRFSTERVFYRPFGRSHRDYSRDGHLPFWRTTVTDFEAEGRRMARAFNREEVRSLRDRLNSLRDMEPVRQNNAFKETRLLVSHLREAVALKVLNGPNRPSVVLFDEWHRYRELMLKDRNDGRGLLAKTLQNWTKRPGAGPRLTLFVSATPFEVPFGAEKRSSRGDLSDLCRLLDPTDEFQQAVSKRRTEYFAAWDRLALAHMAGRGISAAQLSCKSAATAFSRTLYTRILRTERPLQTHGRSTERGRWQNADLAELLKARRLAVHHRSGTDLVGLWHSSTHHLRMPDAYKLAQSLGSSPSAHRLPQRHWKRALFAELIKQQWAGRPPLWIPPSAKDSKGKILVFSAWRSVPKELTYFFHDGSSAWRGRPSNTSTPLGAFPEWEATSLKKQGWRVFYPSFAAFDPDPRRFLSWVSSQLPEAPPTRRPILVWANILCGLDLAYAQYRSDLRSRLQSATRERQRLLGATRTNDWKRLLGGSKAAYAHIRSAMSAQPDWQMLPGWSLMAELSRSHTAEQLIEHGRQRQLLGLSRHLNNYFNRPISQKLIRSVSRGHYSDAIIRYCRANEWRGMWKEYLDLLRAESLEHALDHVNEALFPCAARRAGAGWITGNAGATANIVQPFVESRLNQSRSEAQQDEEQEGFLVTSQRRKSFNSPFFPHVLVSTSIGQEGVDFHRYCDTVVHWNPPTAPLALEQREGRVDRFRSLQVRRLESHLPKLLKDASGISPDFCIVDKRGTRLNRTNSLVYLLPHSREEQVWNRCMERLHYSRLFLGAPDVNSLESQLQARLGKLSPVRKQRALEDLASISVKLSPFSRNQ